MTQELRSQLNSKMSSFARFIVGRLVSDASTVSA